MTRSFKRVPWRKYIIRTLLLCIIWGGIGITLLLFYYASDLPSTKKLTEYTKSPNILVLAKNGEMISRIGGNPGEYLEYKDFPDVLVRSVLAVEDKRFYDHFGVDVYGLIRAMMVNLAAGRVVQGGSTITQQLAKIVFLSHERTMKRKIQEMMLALWLEREYTKEEILTMYLNRVYLGSGNYGVDAASRSYFGKSAREINMIESALLAGLLKAPSRFSPHQDAKSARERTRQVLTILANDGDKQAIWALKHGTLAYAKPPKSFEYARHFADYISGVLPDYVGISTSDLTVKTTLDATLQQHAENTVSSLKGDDKNADEAAVLMMTPDGAIRAMVGGRNFEKSQFNRATQALRSPGSLFKLFVYLAAFEQGMNAEDRMIDEPIAIGDWIPGNYTEDYRGEVSLTEAFAYSINTVAVQVSERIGRNYVIEMARRLGVTSELDPVPSIALGATSVTLLEMTGAMAHIANSGYQVTPYGITEIRDSRGKVIYERLQPYTPRLLDKSTVESITRMLSSVVAFGTAKGVRVNTTAAGKTGTSQDYRDAWFVGFTPGIVTGVWVGNDDNRPMKRITGGSLPVQIWTGVVTHALENPEYQQPSLVIPDSGTWAPPEDKERSSFWNGLFGGD